MSKAGAVAILLTITLGLAGWAGTVILDLSDRVVVIETSKRYDDRILSEIRDELKEIRKILKVR